MALTFDQLVQNTPLWLYSNNRSLVQEMPTIVEMAHNQLINLIDHDLFRTIITGKSLLASTYGVLDLSSEDPRVLEIRAVRVQYQNDEQSWTPLQRRDLETMSMMYARNRPRRPRYYSEYSSPLVIKAFPQPDMDYVVEISANVEPPVLSATNQTNIISEQFPRLMEKATFRQGALYMKNWEDAQIYEKEMATALSEANAQIQRRRRDDVETRPVETANITGA